MNTGAFKIYQEKEVVDAIKDYLKKGAVVLDVRTIPEYEDGHAKGSKNIVLDTISSNIDEIKSYGKPVITVCRSGARSNQAKEFLEAQGIDVINGGPWQNVDRFV